MKSFSKIRNSFKERYGVDLVAEDPKSGIFIATPDNNLISLIRGGKYLNVNETRLVTFRCTTERSLPTFDGNLDDLRLAKQILDAYVKGCQFCIAVNEIDWDDVDYNR